MVRKVKGHASLDDISKGLSTNQDKWGNDRADELADEGVRETILGRIENGDWLDPADAAGLHAGQGEATGEPRRPRGRARSSRSARATRRPGRTMSPKPSMA